MSSHYGIVFPEFWSGETGREIRTHGGKDGQLVGLYLMSAPNATMIGLFSLPLRDLKHDTGIGVKGLVRAFTVLGGLGFADYDARTEHVWVREMAKFRLGLQKRSPLDPDDKRVTGIQRLYDKLAENPYLEPFFDRYAKELRLRGKRRSGRPAEPLLDVALARGFEGPSKPVNRDQGSEIRDQVQGSGDQESGTGIRKSTAASRRPVEILSKKSDGRTEDEPHGHVSAPVRYRQGAARTGLDDRRRGVEGADPRPLSQIGFHGSGSSDAEPGDVGSGTGAREAARPAADPGAEHTVTAAADGRPAESPGVNRLQGAPGVARATGHHADDQSTVRRVESDARTNSGVETRAGVESASGEPSEPMDQNGEGVESPGQAKLRLAIAELRRKLAR